MSNLTPAIRALSEAAGKVLPIDILLDAQQGRIDESSVGKVLGWLAKADVGFRHVKYSGHEMSLRLDWMDDDLGERWVTGHGDTLNAALAAAVVAWWEAAQ